MPVPLQLFVAIQVLSQSTLYDTVSDMVSRKALEGRWVGEQLTLTIDQDAVQANRNPAKPFEWQAMQVLNTTDNMVVFELDGDRFIGLLNGDHMTLTQAGREGFHILIRQH